MPVYPGAHNHAHRHGGIGLMTPAAVHHGHAAELHAARAVMLDATYQRHPERFVRKPPAPPELPTAAWINKPKEVVGRHRSVISNARRLTRLDRLRSTCHPSLLWRAGPGFAGSAGGQLGWIMSTSRGRNAQPYEAQLRKLLANDADLTVFSAATLEERFEHPQHQKRGTNIGRIHKALRKAFAEGKIVAFLDDSGLPLREAEIVVPGSKAIGQPQMFGRPGTESPRPGFREVAYEETLRRGIQLDDDADAPDGEELAATNGHAAEEPTDGEGDAASDAGDDERSDGEGLDLSLEDTAYRVTHYPAEKTTVPAWVDERVLRAWTSLDCVAKHMVRGLDQTHGADKFELIRAGVTRKQRSWRSESLVAGNLAKMCRTSPVIWSNVAGPAITHYLGHDERSPLYGDLLEVGRDPLGYYEQSEHPPEAVLLIATALGVDEGVLELIAADCARELGEIKALDKASAQAERIETLEAEVVELRRAAKDADTAVKDAGKREKRLVQEVEALRAAQAQAGEAADEARAEADAALLARAEEAEAALDKLESARIPELEAEIEGLTDAGQRLEAAQAELHDERRLRVQAEQDAARHSARARAMTDELSRASELRNLPTDNAGALLDALSRPIGQAARHAAERLGSGRARPDDELLLELAATVAQMNRRLDSADYAAAAAEQEAAVEAAVVEEAETVVETAADSDTGARHALVEESAALESQEQPANEPQDQSATEPQAPAAPAESARRLRRRSKIKVRPLGGAGEVGGSAILVTNNSGHTVLLDCGQRVRGEYGLDTEPAFHRGIGQEGRLHAILLSHAHIDHVGSLPILHRQQSGAQHERIPVYMTEPTRKLAEIMLMDSAKIQESRELDPAEVGFLDYGKDTMEAAYRRADVNRVLDDEFVHEAAPALAVPIPDTSFVARFIPVAHVLGSCAIHLTDTENDQTLLYTGDLGPIAAPQITLPHYSLAEMLPAHLVVMESTYGSRRPECNDGRQLRRSMNPREAAVKRLCQLADHAHGNSGCLLLPAFSLGRTQELAMLIEQAKRDGQAPPGEIIVAGMGERITQVYAGYSKGSNAWARAEDMPRADELGGRLRKHPELSFDDVVGDVLEAGFSYIIASPAMLGSGWSRSFLTSMADNPIHSVVMSGFVPRDGGRIPRLHTLHKGEMLNLDGQPRRIQCEFEHLRGLSAHAPAADLHQFAQYMARQGDAVAFAMVHGDEASQNALAEDVRELPGVLSAEPLHNGLVWQPQRP